jgi:uncharacterized protein (TIGR03000 family)
MVFLALPALALGCMLLLPESSSAQRFRGRGWGYSGFGPYNSSPYGYGYGSGFYGYGQPGIYNNWGPGYGYSGFGTSPWYSGDRWIAGDRWYSQPYVYGGTSQVNQSFYPPDAAYQAQGSQAPMDRNSALIRVRVPPDAKVFFDNNPTQQIGPERAFVTPPLPREQNSAYEITARWMENGQERRETRTVRPIAGQAVNVDFLAPASNQQQQQQQQQRSGTTQQRQNDNTQPPLPKKDSKPPDR